MIISRYTFILDTNGQYYLYNSLSNALVEVDYETYSFLKKYETEGTPVELSSIDDTFVQVFTKKRFLCETVQSLREQRHFMHLTIVPTMDCMVWWRASYAPASYC